MDFLYTTGFIGAGNMGGTLAGAVCRCHATRRVAVSCRTQAETRSVAERLGCVASDNIRVAGDSRLLFLGVKPGMIDELAAEISPAINQGTILVSMLAGVSIARLEELFGADRPIIRILPNTPCAVGQGIILYSHNARVSEEDVALFRRMLEGVGLIDEIPEGLIDAAGTLTGCGPAFAYMFIEALADGAVACGVPRESAQKYAAAMLAGSARMVLESGKHPGALKDAVCSPGGTTIEGVESLEKEGFRHAAAEAVRAAYEKTRRMGH